MNIHIECAYCGYGWEHTYADNRSAEVDISEVHGAKVLAQQSKGGQAIRLVQIDEVFLLLITGAKGREKTICKVVPEETATPMYTQAVNDFLDEVASELPAQ